MFIWGSTQLEGEYRRHDGTETTNPVDNELDRDAFLRLLTTQLRYQSPLDPIKDQDFIAQMAQFSSLEQTQNLTEELQRYVEVQAQAGLMAHAMSLLGREVTVFDEGIGAERTGRVESVKVAEDGVPQLLIGGETFGLGAVSEIHDTAPESGEA